MIRVLSHEFRVLEMQTRMPFRYGIAELVALPHLFVRLQVEVDGVAQQGTAAEGLAPKWFTKDPLTTFRHDVDEMLDVITHAVGLASEVGAAASAFELWQAIYAKQKEWGTTKGYPPLLWAFGVTLAERAIIDAVCRAKKTTFAAAVRNGTLGIRLGDMHPELAGQEPRDLLPVNPLQSFRVRHTVGLSDPLRDSDIPANEVVNDGLPQSLVKAIEHYGLTHLKIKLCGDFAKDLPRLRDIAGMFDGRGDVAFTLDGNEQFKALPQFRELWESLTADPVIARFLQKLIFVEQPFHRSVALSEELTKDLLAWKERPPMIIDESDATIDSVRLALAGGYVGTSHKNCKGVFKGVANACLIAHRQHADPKGVYTISGEDLANVGPLALLQDLAVIATLGIDHVERNGHHYFAGLSMFPPALQKQVLANNGDLYHRHTGGYPVLTVKEGVTSLTSVTAAPFGLGFDLDLSGFQRLEDWKPSAAIV